MNARGWISRIMAAAKGLLARLRRKPQPAMIGTPPSARKLPAIPADPAEHAIDFAVRYYEPLEAVTRKRMRQLGIPEDRIGIIDPDFDFRITAFHPTELDGGGVHPPTGRINLDAGNIYPELLAGNQPPEVSLAWFKARLRHKFDAGIAHEYEEALGWSHQQAVREAPNTALPIMEGARYLLRIIALAETWKGRQ